MGTFNGNNVKISGLNLVDNEDKWNVGFFGETRNTTIKNVIIEGTVTSSVIGSGGYAGLIASAKGDVVIENCDVSVDVDCGTYQNAVGGILGWYDNGGRSGNTSGGTLYIRNCINRGFVKGSNNVGGIIGTVYFYAGVSSVVIENCANYGTISGSLSGGIIGRNYTSASGSGSILIENCINSVSSNLSTHQICDNQSSSYTLKQCYYKDEYGSLQYGPTGSQIQNCNTFLVDAIESKYYAAASGTYTNGTSYTTGTDLLDIMNDWVTVKNSGSSTYKEWKYSASGQLVFTDTNESGGDANINDLAAAPSSGTFAITDLTEFTKLNTWINNGSTLKNVTIQLQDDLVVAAGNWTPIGNPSYPFKGTFDGNGKTIKLGNVIGSNGSASLFGAIDGANIKNVNVEIGSIDGSSSDYVGGLVGKGIGVLKIENCTVKTVINGSSSDYVGGVVGYIDAAAGEDIVIRNCVNIMQVQGKTYAGGIVGYAGATANSIKIENCGNRGQIGGTNKGGIIGYSANSNTQVENCFSQYLVTADTSSGSIGGYIYNGNVTNCYAFNNGTVGNCKILGTSSSAISSLCYEFSYDGSPTVCIINNNDAVEDGKNIVTEKLNPWCTAKNAVNPGTYTLWIYEDTSGAINFQ